MALATSDNRPRLTNLYASLTAQWARQTVEYSRSVRLYNERVGRQRRQGADGLGRATQVNGSVRGIVDLSPMPGPTELPAEATGRRGKTRSPLTARQREIADLIAQGLTNTQIATKIVVSRGTVGNHIGHMLRRLHVKNRAEIAVWAIRYAELESSDD